MKFKKLMGSALAGAITLSAFTGGALSVAAQTKDEDLSRNAASYSEEIAAGDDYGYLLVHFVGQQEDTSKEQLYFSISPDAKDWHLINGGTPVSTITRSSLPGSDGGIRDPHIVRKHDGTGFYIIATDLSIYNLDVTDKHGGNCWTVSQWQGSHSIVIWEMDNEMNLTEPRMAEIAPKNAGCTWAPESIWDEEKNAYMVFWSALGWRSGNKNGSYEPDQDWAHHIYRCYTTDFVTFTEPEIYMASEQHIIDTTILKEGDTYYRFTKIETGGGDSVYNPKYGSKTVFMETGKSLSGEFRMVGTYQINGKHWSKTAGYEGAEIFRLHDRDVTEGDAQWCLALDNFGAGGYKAFITNDITKGNFAWSEMNFEVATRHGSFLPLTKGEYDALCDKWNNGTKPEPNQTPEVPETPRDHEEVFSMTFDKEDGLKVAKGEAALGKGSTAIDYVEEDGIVAAKFDGSDYIEIDGSTLAGKDGFTVSFTAKFTGKSWVMYTAADTTAPSWPNEKYVGILWGDNGSEDLTAQRWKNAGSRAACATMAVEKNEWNHITIVFGKRHTSIFINGAQVAKQASTVDLTEILGETPIIYLGRAQWSGGEYSNFLLGDFKIYNWGMTVTEVRDYYNKATV